MVFSATLECDGVNVVLIFIVARRQFAARGDKAVRAQSMRGRMALEGLYVPVGAAFLPDFRAELLSFPTGRHDDQVDAIGVVGQLLDTMVRPAPPTPVHKIVDAPVARFASLNWQLVAIALSSGRLALLPSLSVEQLHDPQEEFT